MKMNFGKRVVLFLHWLLSLLLFASVIASFIAPQLLEKAAALVNSLLGAGLAEIASIAALAVYALFAVLAVVVLFSGKNKRRDRNFITVDSSDTGRTRIAISAVDQMIRQAVRGVEGIGEMKSGIVNNDDSISINCSVAVLSGAHVPTVTMNIQRVIRSYIELNCGVAVREVSVSVHSLESAEGKTRGRKGSAAAAPAAVVPAAVAVSAAEPVKAVEPVQQAAPVAEDTVSGVPEEPVEIEEAQEAAVEEENELPEIQPIVLTLDPPAEEAAAEEPQTEE